MKRHCTVVGSSNQHVILICMNMVSRKGSLLLWFTSTVPRLDLQMLVLKQIMISFDIPENLCTPEINTKQ